MSASGNRKRRPSSTPEVQDNGDLVGASGQEFGRGRRTRQRRSDADDVDELPENDARLPANGAAAAAEAPSRMRQQRILFSQQEADAMTLKIQDLTAAAQDAQERAQELGFADNAITEQVAKAVRFMLFKNYEKPDVPVKRQEIVDILQKDQPKSKQGKKLPSLVLTMAAGKLATAFGLELLELKRPAAGEAGRKPVLTPAENGGGPGEGGAGGGGAIPAVGGTQTYVLRSLLPTALQKSHNLDPADDHRRGLMTVIAALIQLAGGQMEQGILWGHLSQLGIDQEEHDNQFGQKGAEEILVQMEKARYLVVSKVASAATGQQVMYSLGEGAKELEGCTMKAQIDKWLNAAPTGMGPAEEVEDE